ncbi:kinesin-like protein [Theileria orientalis strain Shintoku]|uniref:Kinesin-like protein n=1 Tax=Theileria orientalis strain Shintoku TaxID=869250 RepID=J4C8A4_THEOR|nr:kinesin-like protein [Theileria orientalis strain Shintoku]BAM40443.1 kinesin-like protein [Theileria orientalis strain Shintoku]|eukprot:XP_009690744.1 kinesin-like protein [Theileria orientalis strain Shintoku]
MIKKYPERGRIDVIVRKRPLNEIEISRGDKDIVVCNNDCGIIREYKCKIDGTSFVEEHEFKVDRFYDEKADNEQIYNEYVKPLVECAFVENMTCSCFTYGQTGSGKTYTMIGSRITNPKLIDSDQKVVAGIYEYAANDIYRIIKERGLSRQIDVVLSFFEIYSGKLYDLLQNRKPLESLDNGKNEVIIRDLSAKTVNSKDELVELMLSGLNLRKIGQNSQNDRSSRSHALLRIELKNKETSKLHGTTPLFMLINKHKLQTFVNSQNTFTNTQVYTNNVGSLVFIDLAGSERGADSLGIYHTPDKSRSAKQSFERQSTTKSLFGESVVSKASFEGTCINKSLLALKECIRAMESEKHHVPFRDSELTKVLRDIFLRESKNVMIANLSPSNRCFDQTINTMRYASKVKSFKVNTTNCGNNSNGSVNANGTYSTIGNNNASGSGNGNSSVVVNGTNSTICSDNSNSNCNGSANGHGNTKSSAKASNNSKVSNNSKASTNSNCSGSVTSSPNTTSRSANRTNINSVAGVNGTTNAINKSTSPQPTKPINKYKDLLKSTFSCRLGREAKRSNPNSSNGTPESVNNNGMDLDKTTADDNKITADDNKITLDDSNFDDAKATVDDANNSLDGDFSTGTTAGTNGDAAPDSLDADDNGGDFDFKSQLDTVLMQNVNNTMGDLDFILGNLELNEANTALYRHLVGSLPDTLDRNKLTSLDSIEKITEMYQMYNRISILSRCVQSPDTIQHVSNVLRVEFKLLLHLKQLIDCCFNQEI